MEPMIGEWLGIGWLHPDHPHPEGLVPPDFLEKLKELVPLGWESCLALGDAVAAGFHTCEYCEQAWGGGNIGIPSGGRLFYCPEMIAHYVERHRYAPPLDFIEAVLACPLPGSEAYSAAVARFRIHP